MNLRPVGPLIILWTVLVGTAVHAQQPGAPAVSPGGQGTPPLSAWTSPELPEGPIILDTAIEHQIRLFVTKGLDQPWSMAFLPDGGILVTERPGRLRIVRDGILDPVPVSGVPQVRTSATPRLVDTGLMDIALHPHFNENKLVYFTYHKPPSPDNPHGFGGALTLGRGRLEGSTLTDVRDILSSGPSSASRIVFGNDGMLYMSIGVLDPPGGQGQLAQDTSSLGGKVLRLRDDGSIPPDNPFVDRPGYRPEIYTLGHRNVLGLGVNPETGDIWAVEAGPNGGDEINVLRPGQNFGHPVVGFGRFYAGPRVSESPSQEGMEPPIVFWVPGITPSGITFYTGERFPNWKGHVFVGGLQEGRVPRSGHLERIYFNPNWEEVHHEAILRQLQQRIRDVRQGPDGYLYLLTAESDGALIRVEPFKPTP